MSTLVTREEERERQYLYSNTLVANSDIFKILMSAFTLRGKAQTVVRKVSLEPPPLYIPVN